jgi:hypothetical protein
MDGEASNRLFLKTGDLIVLQSETDDGYCSVSLDDYKGCMSPSKNHGTASHPSRFTDPMSPTKHIQHSTNIAHAHEHAHAHAPEHAPEHAHAHAHEHAHAHAHAHEHALHA